MQKGTEAFALPILETADIEHSLDAQAIHAPTIHAPAMPAGFRHFLGTPKPSQRFKAYGIDPLDAPRRSGKLRTLMNRLSRRMDAAISWPAHHDASI